MAGSHFPHLQSLQKTRKKSEEKTKIQIILWRSFPFLRSDIILLYIRNDTRKKGTEVAKRDLSIDL